MSIMLSSADVIKLCQITCSTILAPQIESVNSLLNPILNSQAELCLYSADIPVRFTYRNKEYRALNDISTKWYKAFPLHKSLHNKMPPFLAVYEPFELETARIKTVIVKALSLSNSVEDLQILLPNSFFDGVNINIPNLPSKITLSNEEIENFQKENEDYLFLIKQAIFVKSLMFD